jgi:hypothetical protein
MKKRKNYAGNQQNEKIKYLKKATHKKPQLNIIYNKRPFWNKKI